MDTEDTKAGNVFNREKKVSRDIIIREIETEEQYEYRKEVKRRVKELREAKRQTEKEFEKFVARYTEEMDTLNDKMGKILDLAEKGEDLPYDYLAGK